MEVKHTLEKRLHCEICFGKMHFIKRTLCESGITEIEYFEGMDKKDAVNKIMHVTKCEKKDVDMFIELLMSVGCEFTDSKLENDGHE